MFRSYIKLAIRNLSRQKVYSLINIVGLSIGIAAFLLIMLYVQNELSYDKYISGSENIYRCVEIQHSHGAGDQHVAITMGPLAKTLEKDFPEIISSLRLWAVGKQTVNFNEKVFNQENIVFAEPEIFEILGVKLLSGNPNTALNKPMSVIISEKVAKKYFFYPEKALGNILKIDEETYKITGVIKDFPQNFHLKIEMIISFSTAENRFEWLKSWENNSLVTYVKLIPHADIDKLHSQFKDFITKYIDDADEIDQSPLELYLQPLNEIHLKSGHIKFQNNNNPGNINLIYAFIIIAFLIIIIACINFINIAIARSVKRAKEVGIRKVLGANRSDLFYQFIGESIIITFISILFALFVLELILPVFNLILNNNFSINFTDNILFNIGLLLLLIFISLFSGSYPAFYLSKFQVVKALKGAVINNKVSSGLLNKVLVIIQFVISIFLIISVLVIRSQIDFVVNKDVGYNIDQLVSIPLYRNNSDKDKEAIKNELIKNPNILDVSFSSRFNGISGTQSTITVDDTTNTHLTVRFGFVDYNYFSMMEIPIIEGRNFDRNMALDRKEAVILNQAAVKYLKWNNPIGKQFTPFFMDTLSKKTVIGVIKDYHYASMHNLIEPAAFIVYPRYSGILCVRLKKETEKETLAYIESKWNKVFPSSPFELKFGGDFLQDNYKAEKDTLKIFSYFTLLSIIISCMGLYGLTSLMIEQRTKEIGIRKVLGSSSMQIVMLLIKNFIWLVLIAGLIAIPLAWYFMDIVLQSFAYRIPLSWHYFVIAIMAAIFIAGSTILYHAIKSAVSKPIKALKYE